MKRSALVLVILLCAAITGFAQTRYIVQFKNKASSPYSLSNPLAYLSQKAIDRRNTYHIAIDSTDLPVTPRYIDSIQAAGAVTILNASRWLNQVSIQTTDAATLAKINSLSFVVKVAPIAARMGRNARGRKWEEPEEVEADATLRENGTAANVYNYGNSAAQVNMHNGAFLHNIGLHGELMTMGILDGGFMNYLTLSAFDSVRNHGQILGTWDFVALEASVNEDNPHGMECFSTIASNIPGQFVGTAPKASFYLFRSEDANSEYPIEEHNWVCAAERLDSAGGDVISSSLGYSTFDGALSSADHTYEDMNGNTTIAARGADLAAKKGILVIIAAGNEGNTSWHYITSPADADSVLTVGAVNASGFAATFTSLGPSSDGRVKPDVASLGVGTTIENSNNTIGRGSGTSYATPNLAGLATCLWQGFKEVDNMHIIYALRAAGNRTSNPNDSIGYGIPDMKKALMYLLKQTATSSATENNCSTNLSWSSKDMNAMRYEIERQLPGQSSFTKIAIQSGTGNSFNNHSYTYTDALTNAQQGQINYRIRQVIDTAAGTLFADYIDTTSVNLTAACTTTGVEPVPVDADGMRITPNPVQDHFTLTINTNNAIDKLYIRITDAKGSMMEWIQKSKGSGNTSFDIPAGKLASGKYFVSVYDGNRLLGTKQIVKL